MSDHVPMTEAEQPREPIKPTTQTSWVPTLTEIGAAIAGARGAMEKFLKSNAEFLRQLAHSVIAFPTAMRSAWVKAAEQGWYLPPMHLQA
jgi:hypothetical protein